MKKSDDRRRRQLARIHCQKKDLGLEDETYREILEAVAGVTSAAELDDAGRRAVIDYLRRLGAKWKGPKSFPGRPHNIDARPELRKVEAILADGGKPWSYADAIAERMFGVKRIAWCSSEQLRSVIAALARDAKRHGRRG